MIDLDDAGFETGISYYPSIASHHYDHLIASAYIQSRDELLQASWIAGDPIDAAPHQLQAIASVLRAHPRLDGFWFETGPAASFSREELLSMLNEELRRRHAAVDPHVRISSVGFAAVETQLLEEMGLENPCIRVNGRTYGWAASKAFASGVLVPVTDDMAGIAVDLSDVALEIDMREEERCAGFALYEVEPGVFAWVRIYYYNLEDPSQDGAGRLAGVQGMFALQGRTVAELIADLLVDEKWCERSKVPNMTISQSSDNLRICYELHDVEWIVKVTLSPRSLNLFEERMRTRLNEYPAPASPGPWDSIPRVDSYSHERG